MLLAASLVMLMTPGLAFFYGGLVGRSNTLTIMIQSFASMGITTVLWWLVGYSLCFNGGADGIYGNFHLALLRHVSVHSFRRQRPKRRTNPLTLPKQQITRILTSFEMQERKRKAIGNMNRNLLIHLRRTNRTRRFRLQERLTL